MYFLQPNQNVNDVACSIWHDYADKDHRNDDDHMIENWQGKIYVAFHKKNITSDPPFGLPKIEIFDASCHPD